MVTINDEEILIMGGLKINTSNSSSSKKFEIENKIMSFNTRKSTFKYLKQLPFKKKLSQVVYNGEGKLFFFVLDQGKNNKYPQIFEYNLNKNYPKYNRFLRLRARVQREGKTQWQGEELQPC